MNLRQLAIKYNKSVNEDSCPIHVFNELPESKVDKIDKKYRVGEKLTSYCKQDDCEKCWNMEL